jgi:hypothetical protein
MFFCFREVKSELADLMLSRGVLMTNWDGVVEISSKDNSAADVWRQMDRRKIFVWVGPN